MKLKVILTVLVITVLYFFLGWLIYGIILDGFYKENTHQYAGLMKTGNAAWAYLLSNLCWGVLIVYILSLAGIKTFYKGLIIGLIVFFLASFSYDVVFYATMHLFKGRVFVVDVIVSTLLGGLFGGLAGLFLGMGKK